MPSSRASRSWTSALSTTRESRADSSYSEALAQVRWGYSKDGAHLPQVNLAMLVGRGSGLPLYYRKVASNIADVSTVKPLIRDMEPGFGGKVRLVMDRGFWSAPNVNAMMREHFKFLMGLPASPNIHKDAVDAHGAELRSWENYDPATGLYGMRLAHCWDYEEARRQGRRHRLRQGPGRLLRPVLQRGHGPFDALAVYRDKDAIEKRFGDVKGPLDFRTPRVSAEETLGGKILVMFVALVLTSWLRRRMQETGLDEDYTLSGLLDEVETIERYTREGHRPRILEVTLKQRAVFERLGFDPPATS